ncbi:transmembrane channel-like protein 6 isoform X4 [Trachypithecus francoisi]|uniref:transmembrane channel-like protein 6 isoform X4 n=1 Tax=Trachypithecus francoisi TaxID=54180 RepID=UPI00141B1627|nr:transmembrane channel-like protein 6 isoform X4 [Trachypithecus francoisi]XP_033038250.1 transmembrane channel-like protein 6 isoform X4 [Trachypithecus francoisi]
MAQPLAFILDVPETPGDQGQEPSPYDESEVHDSFHQLIQEQSQWVAQEGLELQQREQEATGSGQQTLRQPEGTQSTATLRILASMPSRTIGRSRGAIISQYYSRTVQLRRRSSRPLLGNLVLSARPSLRLYDLELDPTAREEEEKQSLLVKELQSLAVAQRDHMLRGMPLSLAEKRSLREKSRTPAGKWRGQRGGGGVFSCCGRLRYACVLQALHSLGLALLSGLQALTPWRYALKRIGSQFGSSVLSYFLFLKTLLAFNALLLLLLVAFIMGPQVAFPPTLPGPAPVCTGLELLTGAGCFTHTVMFYGHYSNATLNQPCGSPLDGSQCTPRAGGLPYNMPLAYLYTVGAGFFITCITLVYSMAHSFGESYRVGSTSGIHAITVFCSWDYKVTQKRASRLQQDNIRTRLKELLAEWQLRQSPRSVCGRLRQAAALGLAWLLCLGTALGCAVAVHVFSEFLIQSPEAAGQEAAGQEAALLVLPLVVGLLNLGAPYLCRVLAALEPHDSPVLEVYVAICRNLILKLAILGTLCYHWLGRRVAVLQGQCWEDFVGQELYRFLVMDFVLMLLDTLFGELVWSRIISEKKLKRRRKPEFDIARNVLELIYGQTLTWLGVLFSPLLPAVQIIKLLLVFYVKKTSLLANCQAPRRPWLASHMSTVFLTLLCFPAFLGAAVFLCYAVWQVKPSSTCGPFRTLDSMYEAGRVWVRYLEAAGPRVSWLPWVHRYLVENTFFVFLVSALLLAVIYLNIQVVRGQRRVICLLKEQISNACILLLGSALPPGFPVPSPQGSPSPPIAVCPPAGFYSGAELKVEKLVEFKPRVDSSLQQQQETHEGEDKIFLINKLHSIYERKEREERSRVGTTEETAAPPALLTEERGD